jgi:hypothetical protein
MFCQFISLIWLKRNVLESQTLMRKIEILKNYIILLNVGKFEFIFICKSSKLSYKALHLMFLLYFFHQLLIFLLFFQIEKLYEIKT